MDLTGLINKEIAEEDDQYLDSIYREKWRPSNFGRCFRYQHWYRKGIDRTNPPAQKTLHLFRVGNIFHEDLQKLAVKHYRGESLGIETSIRHENVIGHADIVLEDEVIDLKTCGNWQWRKINGKNYDVAVDNESYVIQVCSYGLFLGKPKARLAFICKDTYEIKEFFFDVSDWAAKVNEELDINNGFWEQERLPPALPRAYGGKECNYCMFRNTCNEVEGK